MPLSEPSRDSKLVDRPADNSSSNTDTESDDNMEPDKLLEKYISLQKSLYRLQPDMVSRGNQKRRGLKSAATKDLTKIDGSTPKIARIVARIKSIQSDILFDQDEADSKWAALQNNLAKEAAERKRLHLGSETSSADVLNSNLSSENGPYSETTSTSAPSKADAMNMVGDFFSAVSDSNIDMRTGAAKGASTEADSTTVVMKDFGKWTGQSPRRIFEEACKARLKVPNSSFAVSLLLIRYSGILRVK